MSIIPSFLDHSSRGPEVVREIYSGPVVFSTTSSVSTGVESIPAAEFTRNAGSAPIAPLNFAFFPKHFLFSSTL